MAQGTGQARRSQAGKEKASKRNSAASTRKSATARSSAKASPNGRSSGHSTKASSNGRSTKASATGRSSARSTKASSTSSNNRAGGRSKKASATQRKSRTASAGSRSKAAARRGTKKISPIKRVTKPIERAVTQPIGHAVKAAQDGAVKAARSSTLEVAGTSAKVALSSTKQLGRVVRAARPAAGPLGATGAAMAIAGLSARALTRRQTRSRTRVPRPHLPQVTLPSMSLPSMSLPSVSLPSLALRKRRRSQAHLPSVHLHVGRSELLSMAVVGVGLRAAPIAKRVRQLPIQQSIDVAVPLDVAYDEWMKLESLPEGAHTVEKIERKDGDTLGGKLTGRLWPRRWEAEIRDQRDDESFAWRSVKGSDCAGLITFHRIDDRLTRLELQLDVIPKRAWEVIDFALRLADLRAGAELRRFKARVEMISPDAYETSEGDQDEDEQDDEQDDNNDKED